MCEKVLGCTFPGVENFSLPAERAALSVVVEKGGFPWLPQALRVFRGFIYFWEERMCH